MIVLNNRIEITELFGQSQAWGELIFARKGGGRVKWHEQQEVAGCLCVRVLW